MPKYFTGTYTTTQVLSNPATDNPATVTSTGVIDVNSILANAVALYGSAGTSWSITNLGTVESLGSLGVGIELKSGGTITNGAEIATSALIDGTGAGVHIYGTTGIVSNYGTIAGTGTASRAVHFENGGTVTNAGLITNTGTQSTVEIDSYGSATGRVTNSGTIQGSGSAGVLFGSGVTGSLVNTGTITSSASNLQRR